MSIKYGLLALLDGGSKYGYQLRAEFEHATGATWPLNVGQVYTTLNRLERDQLVREVGQDKDGRVRYELTADGRSAVRAWFAEPVSRESRPRDELAIKLALAVTIPGVDVQAIVQRQRAATVRGLQELTRLKRAEPTDRSQSGRHGNDLSWQLVLESMTFQAEAEVRWLDHVEARLLRAQATTQSSPQGAPPPSSTPAVQATSANQGSPPESSSPEDRGADDQARSEW